MPYRGGTFTQGQYYHIYNRGAGRQKIFLNAGNYEYLLRLIRRACQQHGAAVIAYCLMPTHYHFLLRQETDEPLSKFMQVLFTAYVQALNLQQGRTGALFEGRFKHKCVDKWEFLMVLCRYIHSNPVKARLVSRPEDWAYSNYREWIGLRDGFLVDTAFVHRYFPAPNDYLNFVNNAVNDKQAYQDIAPYLFD